MRTAYLSSLPSNDQENLDNDFSTLTSIHPRTDLNDIKVFEQLLRILWKEEESFVNNRSSIQLRYTETTTCSLKKEGFEVHIHNLIWGSTYVCIHSAQKNLAFLEAIPVKKPFREFQGSVNLAGFKLIDFLEQNIYLRHFLTTKTQTERSILAEKSLADD